MDQLSGYPYPVDYDLTNCDKEPLHHIAVVQGHACLLAYDKTNSVVKQTSTNTSKFFGCLPESILGKQLHEFLPKQSVEKIVAAAGAAPDGMGSGQTVIITGQEGQGKWLNCIAHPQGDTVVLELEPFDEDELKLNFQPEIGQAMQRIQATEALAATLQTAAEEVKKITGYDRVMVYRFDAEGHGTVVAEAKEHHLEAFYGLRYPSTDIPPQARELFMKNSVRIISDLRAEPPRIQPSINPGTGKPLDLSYCVCRGVSPIHVEYLVNMGVAASMSIAIVFEEKLWGLIACHHYSPKFTSVFKRNTAWLLGKIISGQLGLASVNEFRNSTIASNAARSRLLGQMSATWDLFEALVHGEQTLLEMNASGGAALCHEGRLELLGKTPFKEEILSLVHWLDEREGEAVFHTSELPKLYQPANNFKETGAGLLAMKLSNAAGEWVLWFKPEVIHTVQWGGDPNKAVVNTAGGARLSPRKSFEKWTQLVKNSAAPWEQYEIETAHGLRQDIRDFIFRKYQHVQQANKELAEAYEDLEVFSYSVSHDLRSPLRTIEGFVNILKEDYGHLLNDEGQVILRTINENAAKMNAFISDLLVYFRTGKSQLITNHLTLAELVQEELKILLPEAEQQNKKVVVKIHDQLPDIVADRPSLAVVLKNLLSNALKYSRKSQPSYIEIGGNQVNNNTIFYIRDNGVGFDMQHAERIFGVFNRLVPDDEYEGTGVGLAIVKRIINRHGGTISVESEPGKGATFFVQLPHNGHRPNQAN